MKSKKQKSGATVVTRRSNFYHRHSSANKLLMLQHIILCRLRLKRDGTGAETRFRLSSKRTSPFKSAGASVQSTAGSRGVRISFSNAGYTTFRRSVRVLATHSISQFPLHFPSRASPCAIRFQTHSTNFHTSGIYSTKPIRNIFISIHLLYFLYVSFSCSTQQCRDFKDNT